MQNFFKPIQKPNSAAKPQKTEGADVEMADETTTLMQKAAERPKFVPWIEKYRPTKVDEVSH